jgi:hypothetical protein
MAATNGGFGFNARGEQFGSLERISEQSIYGNRSRNCAGRTAAKATREGETFVQPQPDPGRRLFTRRPERIQNFVCSDTCRIAFRFSWKLATVTRSGNQLHPSTIGTLDGDPVTGGIKRHTENIKPYSQIGNCSRSERRDAIG